MSFDFDECFFKMMEGRKLSQVLIVGHMNPDGDACGCVLGLAHYIHTVYPQYQVYPYLAESLDKGPKKQVFCDTLFDPFSIPQIAGPYAAIACDTATKARMIGRELFDKAAATLVIDHHAANEGYGEENYTEISEACCQNIFQALDQEKLKEAAKEAYPNAADYLYLGILHDTTCFSRADEKIFLAASRLLGMGVDHRRLMKTMHNQTLADKEKEARLLKMAKKVLNGKAACVFVTRQEAEEYAITYEDIHPISGILRDCEDIELGFTMYEEAPHVWRCSFRSDGKWINVNELLLPFGGGGHAGAAGLRKETQKPEELLEEILKRAEAIRKPEKKEEA